MTTAEELIEKRLYITKDDISSVHDSMDSVKDAMIEFAQLHVKEALKQAVCEAPMHCNEGVRNCYSLDNIK